MIGEWYEHGLCKQHRDLVWFPPTRMKVGQCAEAKAVCLGCPVRVECLDHAMREPETSGIWGGLTESERHRLARDRDADRRRLMGAR